MLIQYSFAAAAKQEMKEASESMGDFTLEEIYSLLGGVEEAAMPQQDPLAVQGQFHVIEAAVENKSATCMIEQASNTPPTELNYGYNQRRRDVCMFH